ncbi:hypothetical protein KQI65_07700 [bacterium]|nr:hypothetical protein [bacterium]
MKYVTVIITALLMAASLQAQSVSYQDRLYYTCKVWGLLKYNHSEVSTCKVDWDATLLNTLPAVKMAESFEAFNDVLITMLEAAGRMEPAAGQIPYVPEELRVNRDFRWLQDPVLRRDLRESLQEVLDNFRPHEICHVRDNTGSGGWLVFPGDNPNLDIALQDTVPDEGGRLLCMFTYWNILSWFNPNVGILDVPWDSTLHRNILDVAEANDPEAFYLSYQHFAAGLNDAHVEGHTTWTKEKFKIYGLNIVLGWTVDGYTVVMSDVPEISAGDLLTGVDGESIGDAETRWRTVMSYGNPAVFRRDFCRNVLRGEYYTPIELTLRKRDGSDYTYTGLRKHAMNSSWHNSYYPCDSLARATWKILGGSVGYVHMGNLTRDGVWPMYKELRSQPAIIFDVRNYPQDTATDLAELMFPNERQCVWYMVPDVTFPGTYIGVMSEFGRDRNQLAYKGKVIILCNSSTQSHAEWTCMILRAMPNTVIVGSQTAGADGNVSYWMLTQDIAAGFTSLGVEWPAGGSTQRIGIIPDSIVIPTRDDIIAGRDPVLEKALEIAGVPVTVEHPPMVKNIKLEQNYPNPFNPSTTIRFTFPHAGHVLLYVTDMFSRRVETLIDEHRSAGTSEFTWEAVGLPSGCYAYTLEAGGQTQSRMMFLLK